MTMTDTPTDRAIAAVALTGARNGNLTEKHSITLAVYAAAIKLMEDNADSDRGLMTHILYGYVAEANAMDLINDAQRIGEPPEHKHSYDAIPEAWLAAARSNETPPDGTVERSVTRRSRNGGRGRMTDLKTALQTLGLTQAEFAKRVGYSKWQVNRWCNGRTMPRAVGLLVGALLALESIGVDPSAYLGQRDGAPVAADEVAQG